MNNYYKYIAESQNKVKTYVVSFNTNGGNTIASITVPANQPIPSYMSGKYSSVVRGLDKFKGWYSDASLTTRFYSSTVVPGDITLYAGYYLAGEIVYTTPGWHEFTIPAGFSQVSVVAIGGGGSGGVVKVGGWALTGGTGAGLGYKNNITLDSSKTYWVQVGNGGAATVIGDIPSGSSYIDGNDGEASEFYYTINSQTPSIIVSGYGGLKGKGSPSFNQTGSWPGGGYIGSGGRGGSSGNTTTGVSGPGGAGGYSGNGGNGSAAGVSGSSAASSSGGGGGGYGTNVQGTSLAGGTGLYGKGSTGSGGVYSSSYAQAGSGGTSTNPNTTPITNLYGGGSAGPVKGGNGAVRIVWGVNREFPSTNVGAI